MGVRSFCEACLLCLIACWASAQQTNVVLIVADDLGWSDIGCFGSEIHRTPNLDALAERGVRFTNAYANAPNCAPSRASLMTGLYTPRHGIYTVGSSARGRAADRALIPTPNRTDLDGSFVTLAEALRDAGYSTATIGKWHLNADPTEHGFEINIGGSHAGHPKSYFSPYKNPALVDGPEGEYLTDRLADEAVGFLRAHAEQPFFLYLPFFTVHTPIQGRPEMVAEQRARAEHDPRIKPAYAAMVERMDHAVGRVIGALDELALADNTVVLFVSDNGGHGVYTDNTPLRGSKGMLYEGGIRVPLLIAGRRVARAGASEPAPVIGTDLFPTILELVGVSPPEQQALDGRSLAPLLESASVPGDPWHTRAIHWHFPAYLEAYRSGKNPWRTTPAAAVRVGRYKLIEFFEDGRCELYNLNDDPSETRDLSTTDPARVKEMQGLMRAWRSEISAPVPTLREPRHIR